MKKVSTLTAGNEYKGTFWEDENVLFMIGVCYTVVPIYLKYI